MVYTILMYYCQSLTYANRYQSNYSVDYLIIDS